MLRTILLLALLATSCLAQSRDNNRGTVKIHDGPEADPEKRNEPHVDCDFYVQGFNFHDSDGTLQFFAWAPTGNKGVVTPTGDNLVWTGEADGDGEFNFQKGPYQLPAGHYKLEVYTTDGHPGSNSGQKAKSKVFWVDECAPAPAPYPTPAPEPYPTPAPEPTPAPYEPAPEPEPAPAPYPAPGPAPAPYVPPPSPYKP